MKLYDFTINTTTNLLVDERLKFPEVHSEPSRIFKMEPFAKNG